MFLDKSQNVTSSLDNSLPEANRLLDQLLSLTRPVYLNKLSDNNDDNDNEEDLGNDEIDMSGGILPVTDRPTVTRHKSQQQDDATLNARLALQLLDKWLDLEIQGVDEEDNIINTIHDEKRYALNAVMQLWREALDTELLDLPSPTQMLAKLDDYRHSHYASFLQPDTQSYNILLEGAARRGDIHFCQQVYDWMWTESQNDSLIQPDVVTLRALFKAHAMSSAPNAAESCERLIHDFTLRTFHTKKVDISDIYHSLIHVWAKIDPMQAAQLLRNMAQRHLENPNNDTTQYPPPDTIVWNHVISALSIPHKQPALGAQLEEEFGAFVRALQSRRRRGRGQNFHSTESSSTTTKVIQPDLYTYNALLEGWARLGNPEQANQIYEKFKAASLSSSTGSSSIRPNVITYTLAMKANQKTNLDRVNQIAQECLGAFDEQLRIQAGVNADDDDMAVPYLVLDHEFFHVWLQACHGNEEKGPSQMEEILFQIMPSVGVSPNTASFVIVLHGFLDRDDLEGATKWLMSHVKSMDEGAIVEWTCRLVEMGDIELVSFLDKLFGSMRRVPPKSLLQIIVQQHLQQVESLEKLLSKLSIEQGLQVLQWIPIQKRSQRCYSIVMRAMAEAGAGPGAEELWEIWKTQANPHAASKELGVPMEAVITGEMYSSLIVAWSKSSNEPVERILERTKYWFDTWLQDEEARVAFPPTRRAQTAVLSSMVNAFVPKAAEEFLRDLKEHYQCGRIEMRPDLVMHNLVLKGWIMAASGHRAQRFLEEQMKEEKDIVSYNSIVQAYVKERKLEQARTFIQDVMIDQGQQSPDMGTFRSLLGGWSKSRDTKIAAEQATSILEWMNELFEQGVMQELPDDGILRYVKECHSRGNNTHGNKGTKWQRKKEKRRQN